MTTRISDPRDYTDDPQTRWNQLPGKPEIWHEKETGKVYAVYFVPGTQPPIPMLWHVPDEAALQIFYGDTELYSDDFAYDRDLSRAEIRSTGAFEWGTTDEIPQTEGDPWAGFLSNLEQMQQTMPWMSDPGVFTVVAQAWLEGRDPELWEFDDTEWFSSRNQAERDWAYLNMRDPEEAARLVETNKIEIFNKFSAEGIENIDDALTSYMAQKVSEGSWSEAYAVDQINYLVFGQNATGLDEDLAGFMSGKDIAITDPATHITQVKDTFREWLGPGYPPTQEQVDKWTQRIRQNPEAGADELIQSLQKQRLALFPNYEDPTLSYEDIASPWRGFMSNMWGQTPDETDPVFTKLLQLNDAYTGGQLLRREGLNRNIGQVTQDAMGAVLSQGGQIRRAM